MPSFDVVSEVDNEEVRNAVDIAARELETRYDFRGVEAEFKWSKDDISLLAEAEFQLQQMRDILRNKLVKRGVDPMAMELSSPVFSGKRVSQKITFRQGIDQALAKRLVKMIKDSKGKVQAAIQGDKLRVTGKKRDDLQAAMALLRTADIEQALQFNNFRD